MAQSTAMPVDISELMQALSMSNINLNEFRGEAQEDALKWIAQFERQTRLWKDKARVEQIRYYLDGTASYWYEDEIKSKIETTTFAEFKKLFLKKFVDTEKREFAIRKLKSMTYNPNDHRVSNFIIDYKHWNSIINPAYPEKDLVRDLFERFPVSFQCKFLNVKAVEDVDKVEEFTKIAMRIEKCLKLESKESNSLMRASVNKIASEKNDVMNELLLEIKSMRAELSELKNDKHNMSSKVKSCFKCAKPWPACGCTSKCKKCDGNYPSCGCGKRNFSKPLIDVSKN